MRTVAKLLEDFEQQIGAITLIPGGGGAFELTVGEELVYSKRATKRHADYDADIKEHVARVLG